MANQLYWRNQIDIDAKGVYRMNGYSIAADKTSYYVSGLAGGTLLDAGIEANYKPQNILITHGHIDHSGGLAKVLFGMGDLHPNIYCPFMITDYVKNSIGAMFSLSKNTPTPKVHIKYKLIGVRVGDKLPLSHDKNKRVNMLVEIVYSHHTVPCVGYGFIEIRSKLRDDSEFAEELNRAQNENPKLKLQQLYGVLKEKGITLTREIEVPLFCFMGDTDEKALYNRNTINYSTVLAKYPSIIIECTFLDPCDEHKKHAREDCHMHWHNLKPYILDNLDKRFILIHFSARYTYEFINEFFIKENLPNVFPMISAFSENQKNAYKNNDENNSDMKIQLTEIDVVNTKLTDDNNHIISEISKLITLNDTLSQTTVELKKTKNSIIHENIIHLFVFALSVCALIYMLNHT